METIPGTEIADLFRQAIKGEVEVMAVDSSWEDVWCGDALIIIGGYKLRIFNDCGELDYVSTATAPDGREGDFDKWYDEADEPVASLCPGEIAKMEAILEAAPVVSRELW